MPRQTDSDNPGDWLAIARSDIEGIEVLIQRRISYSLCSSKLAEILEKVLKAEIIRTGWFLERTHDLLKLGGELNARDPALGAQVRPLCEALAERYIADRYPGFDREDEDWPELLQIATEVRRAMETVQERVGR